MPRAKPARATSRLSSASYRSEIVRTSSPCRTRSAGFSPCRSRSAGRQRNGSPSSTALPIPVAGSWAPGAVCRTPRCSRTCADAEFELHGDLLIRDPCEVDRRSSTARTTSPLRRNESCVVIMRTARVWFPPEIRITSSSHLPARRGRPRCPSIRTTTESKVRAAGASRFRTEISSAISSTDACIPCTATTATTTARSTCSTDPGGSTVTGILLRRCAPLPR